jgi:hypothetical protein
VDSQKAMVPNLSTKASKRKYSWLQYAPTGIAIAGTIVGAAMGVYITVQVLARDVPEIRQDISTTQARLGDMDARQREMATNLTQEQGSRVRADNAIRVLQTSMIAVIQKVEGRKLNANEIREILSNVKEVSSTESAQLPQATVTGQPPQVPPVAIALTEHYKPDFTATLKGPNADGRGNLFAKALFAKNARWEAIKDKGLKVSYEGGSALFSAGPVSFEELQKRSELYNSLSHAVGQTVASDETAADYIMKPMR